MSKPKYWTKKYKVAFVIGGVIASGAVSWGRLGIYEFLNFPLRSLVFILLFFVVGGFISVFLVAMETLDEKPTGYH